MAKDILTRIKTEKKQNLKTALIDEFSVYSIADAQVARIVAQANISRGSFYTYFEDLYDAYEWVLELVMTDIHHDQVVNPFEATIHFIAGIEVNPYYDFLKKYYQVNESLFNTYLSHKATTNFAIHTKQNLDTKLWLEMLVSHESIKEAFLQPDSTDQIINRLTTVQDLLNQKEGQ
ncbi:TetR/AcrR family transcriptional regulator [Leuconostoc falkenbergense]|uniref:TetR/AcrR family transcriptional regulator n=1 Tax=Leuconostoc falkenbergense TaxID=2766470 RepID=UPI0024ADCE7C|nr:TetR/AcrR family transcriptional regulator [Leuconostoc falkenbergense]MDI6666583.1 TetR/AcrR family transcriptional regulator [Leuconostoc falkenbergense]